MLRKYFPVFAIVIAMSMVGLAHAQETPTTTSASTAQPEESSTKWNYEVGLDLAGKSGNSEKIAFGGKAVAKMEREQDELELYVQGGYAKDDGDKTQEEVKGGADYEYKIDERWAWYLRNELEYDKIEGIDLRATIATGMGYYFLNNEEQSLRGRFGLNFRREEYDTGREENLAGGDLGLKHWVKLSANTEMTNEVTFTPAFEDFEQYLIHHESKVDVAMNEAKTWKLSLGIANDYNNTPAPGKRELDTEYFVRLVFSWS